MKLVDQNELEKFQLIKETKETENITTNDGKDKINEHIHVHMVHSQNNGKKYVFVLTLTTYIK